MSIGVLIVSHDNVGEALLDAAINTLSFCPLTTRLLPITHHCDPDHLLAEARKHVTELDDGEGVLVLTDMYGATPSNIACALEDQHRIRVVTGLNLPMLIRVLNYAQLSLDDLVAKALSGGREGIIDCATARSLLQLKRQS